MSKYEAVVVFQLKTAMTYQLLLKNSRLLLRKAALLKALMSGVREDSLTLSTTRQRATMFSTTSRALRSSRLSLSV